MTQLFHATDNTIGCRRGRSSRWTPHGSQGLRMKLKTTLVTAHRVESRRCEEAYLMQWKSFRTGISAPLD